MHVAIAVCLAIVLFGIRDVRAAGASREAELAARAASIRSTLDGISKDVAARGGWEGWAQGLKDYREDIQTATGGKWPWPAKKGYVFQGAAVTVHRSDDLDANRGEGERPFDGILHLDRECKKRNLDLIVAIIPSKLSIYPDYLYSGVTGRTDQVARAPEDRNVSLAVKRLMQRLLENDVEVVDLHQAFAEHRRTNGDEKEPLFYVVDGHYMNRGARLAAEKIAERLKRYDFVKTAMAANPYVGEKGARTDGAKADPDLLIVKHKSDGSLCGDAADSPIVVAGDSHLWYNPNKAHTAAQIAYLTGMPVTTIWKEGLSGEIGVRLASDPHLAKRKVLIVHFSERCFPQGKSRWPLVSLSGGGETKPAAKGPTELADTPVVGVVSQVSQRPDQKADYPHYLMTFYLTGLKDEQGAAIGGGDGVVAVLSMRDRMILPVANTQTGATLRLNLTSWPKVEKKYGSIQTGSLPDFMLEIAKPRYWGEISGQPRLSADDLTKVGQDDLERK